MLRKMGLAIRAIENVSLKLEHVIHAQIDVV
jgi:hypothetical protein